MTSGEGPFTLGRILEGLTVVELGGFYAVPAATAYLTDLGARVIKVEQPGPGDPMRHGRRWAGGGVPDLPGGTLMFAEINRGKEVVAVDLRTDSGGDVFRRLLDGADAFVTNLRRSALERYGAWHNQLPDSDLVYVHLSGYGAEGAERDDRAFDMVAQARSGLMSLLGRSGEPFTFHLAVDQLAAVSTAWATTLSLLGQRAGQLTERYVRCSLLGSAVDFLRLPLLLSAATGVDASFPDRTNVPVPTLNAYRCADDEWIALSVGIAGDAYWPGLCDALALGEGLATEFAEAAARQERSAELVALLDQTFATDTSQVWLDRLRAQGFPSALVRRIGSVPDDPQVRANCVVDCEFPGLGTFPRPVFPIAGPGPKVGAPTWVAPGPVGSDSVDVLTSMGFGMDEIDALVEAGVVGTSDDPTRVP